jgi:translation initiation factor 3 subunit F
MSSSPVSVNISPVVILSILELYLRRSDDAPRVAGALLGKRSENLREIHITNCFPVPLSVTGSTINLNVDFYKMMADLHTKVTRQEKLVGWYITGKHLEKPIAVVHSFFAHQTALGLDTVCLLVDPSLETDDIPIHAFVDQSVGVGEVYGTSFVPVPVNMDCPPEMQTALSVASQANKDMKPSVDLESDLTLLEASIKTLNEQLALLQNYLDDVKVS